MPSDRIVEDVSTEDTLATGLPFIGDITTMDVISAFALPVFILFAGQLLLPETYQQHVLVGVGLTSALGVIALIATPEHTPLGTFVSNFWHHKRRPFEVRYRRKNEKEDVLERSFIEYDERAQDLTEVNRIYPEYDAIELGDGTVSGALRISSANLDTADPGRLDASVDETKDFFENVLDFDIMIYVTTRGFDAESSIQPYRERLNDNDIKQNKVLQYHARHHIRWIKQRMGGRPIREFYIIVPVKEDEVYESMGQDETVSSSVEEIPIIGQIFTTASAEENYKLTQDEVKLQQFSFLDDRLRTVQEQLIGRIGESSGADRVGAAQYAALLKEYWEGEVVNDRDFKNLVGMLPIMVGESDEVQTNKGDTQ